MCAVRSTAYTTEEKLFLKMAKVQFIIELIDIVVYH